MNTEETNQTSPEQTQPDPRMDREQLIAALKNQIEVKELQVKLSLLSRDIAVNQVQEYQAMIALWSMQGKDTDQEEDVVITEEDLKSHPQLAKKGYKAGDTVKQPTPSPVERKLKTN